MKRQKWPLGHWTAYQSVKSRGYSIYISLIHSGLQISKYSFIHVPVLLIRIRTILVGSGRLGSGLDPDPGHTLTFLVFVKAINTLFNFLVKDYTF
jgi:hypothetical protein